MVVDLQFEFTNRQRKKKMIFNKRHSNKQLCICFAIVGICSLSYIAISVASKITEYKSGYVWNKPKVVTPGKENSAPPSDAIVLFDGKDLSQWKNGENWIVKEGYATANKTGITTKKSFGDCQLHIEWASPKKVEGDGQGRGNSGVYFMGKYEVQILDSYKNKTYHDGQAGSVYKQTPPLVNACRPPGEWQTYDILFTAPRFDKAGNVTQKAAFTVLHNGVVVQNHFVLKGGTFWHKPAEYEAHAEKLPLSLQYHRNPVRFRNIWIRELSPIKGTLPKK
ncbi:putative multi-domain protein [hydrothermal vent metagenome]|uniref:Putative multi-domain protein n=1 Tax=hydrothermal vent metagenome TaxID=652676 RepID=A0A3B1E377_9ZZZZ